MHVVAHGFDVARHAVASTFDSSFSFAAEMYQMQRMMLSMAWRATRNVAHHVYDAARSGIHAVHTVIHRTWYYASRGFHRAVHLVRTAWHHLVEGESGR